MKVFRQFELQPGDHIWIKLPDAEYGMWKITVAEPPVAIEKPQWLSNRIIPQYQLCTLERIHHPIRVAAIVVTEENPGAEPLGVAIAPTPIGEKQ